MPVKLNPFQEPVVSLRTAIVFTHWLLVSLYQSVKIACHGIYFRLTVSGMASSPFYHLFSPIPKCYTSKFSLFKATVIK